MARMTLRFNVITAKKRTRKSLRTEIGAMVFVYPLGNTLNLSSMYKSLEVEGRVLYT